MTSRELHHGAAARGSGPRRHTALLIGACALAAAAASPALAQDIAEASLTPLAGKFWTREAAAHLLRRAGFGGTPEEVQRLYEMGMDAAVDSLVDYERINWETPPPMIDPVLLEPPMDRDDVRDLSEDQRRELQTIRRRAEQRTFEEVRVWWIERMVESPRPFEEKMTLFWHGHFTSGMREVRNAIYMYEQNELLRRLATGNFRDMLIGVSRDRAMLTYLDNNRNVKGRPNENYARELLELFTLGVGNYSESDIKAAARAFTGWGFDRDGFVFRARLHDFGRKSFLGESGRLGGLDVIDAILEQRACSQFLARNLLEFFVRPDPDRRLVDQLAGEIRKNGYELKPTMKTLFKSRSFYHDDARGSLVKSPVELLVGSARQLGVEIGILRSAERAMAGMGQELMQPPNVKGWDGGQKWINTATLFNRYNFVGGLLYGDGRERRSDRRMAALAGSTDEPADATSESALNDEAAAVERDIDSMMADAMSPRSRLGRNHQPEYDPTPAIESEGLDTPEKLVDHYAARLLARPLPPEKREQLVEYLRGAQEIDRGGLPANPRRRRRALDRLEERQDRAVLTMIHLMMSTPEYQMN